MSRYIDADAVIKAIDGLTQLYINNLPTMVYREDAINAISELPSANPGIDEWCTDCAEYDKEHHRCPRWNRVIRETVEELRWDE